MSIKIVTDSVSDVPAVLAEQYDITVVPAYINIGDESYLDGVDLTRADFYDNLANYPAHPTTAAPSSGQFSELFERLAAAGAAVCSVGQRSLGLLSPDEDVRSFHIHEPVSSTRSVMAGWIRQASTLPGEEASPRREPGSSRIGPGSNRGI